MGFYVTAGRLTMEMKDYTLLTNLAGQAINIQEGSEEDHLQWMPRGQGQNKSIQFYETVKKEKHLKWAEYY